MRELLRLLLQPLLFRLSVAQDVLVGLGHRDHAPAASITSPPGLDGDHAVA